MDIVTRKLMLVTIGTERVKVCPSVPPFVFAVLFKPSFHVLSCYFHVSFTIEADPTV